MSKNKLKIVLGVVLVVVILLAVYFTMLKKQNGYSVVYLSTGEIYAGKLSTFPQFSLSNAYIFQAVKDPTDPTKSSFQLNPVKDAFWATKKMNINRDNVMFYGTLENSSKIGEALAGVK